jgi:predicted DNA-binding transcriptional regulator AlpA
MLLLINNKPKARSIIMKPLLTEKEAAETLTISVRTLQRLRQNGGAPNYVRIGKRRIAYRVFALDKWLQNKTFNSSAQEYSLA